ncbi:Fc.00g076470.m01.CDS01 [Cosmosporella sp. VM-42]
MGQQHIDELLERYLGLLNEYTQLRENLSQVQSGVYQNIARANFSGERGMRYGQDHYDERMQASRLLTIAVDEKDATTFAITNAPTEEEKKEDSDASESQPDEPSEQAEKEATDETAAKKRRKLKNPIHWFGLFAPMPLRTAQTQSIQAVEQIIPRLVSVNTEMLSLEIEIRRARKRRAKAEAAAGKMKEETIPETQPQTTPVEAV